MPAEIQVQSQDVELAPDGVTIRSRELRNELIQHQSEAVRALTEQIAPIQLEHISIDDQGRVVITDAAFTQAVREHAQSGVATLMPIDPPNAVCVTVHF